MSNFTTILNRGIRRYIDKYMKKRNFGHCEGCKEFDLLIEYEEIVDRSVWAICEKCYTELLNTEKDE